MTLALENTAQQLTDNHFCPTSTVDINLLSSSVSSWHYLQCYNKSMPSRLSSEEIHNVIEQETHEPKLQ